MYREFLEHGGHADLTALQSWMVLSRAQLQYTALLSALKLGDISSSAGEACRFDLSLVPRGLTLGDIFVGTSDLLESAVQTVIDNRRGIAYPLGGASSSPERSICHLLPKLSSI